MYIISLAFCNISYTYLVIKIRCQSAVVICHYIDIQKKSHCNHHCHCVCCSPHHMSQSKCGFGSSGHFMGVAARPTMGRSIIVLGRAVGTRPDIIIALLLYLSMNDTPCFECKCHIVLLKAVIAWHVEVGTLINSPPSMNWLLWWE